MCGLNKGAITYGIDAGDKEECEGYGFHDDVLAVLLRLSPVPLGTSEANILVIVVVVVSIANLAVSQVRATQATIDGTLLANAILQEVVKSFQACRTSFQTLAVRAALDIAFLAKGSLTGQEVVDGFVALGTVRQIGAIQAAFDITLLAQSFNKKVVNGVIALGAVG